MVLRRRALPVGRPGRRRPDEPGRLRRVPSRPRSQALGLGRSASVQGKRLRSSKFARTPQASPNAAERKRGGALFRRSRRILGGEFNDSAVPLSSAVSRRKRFADGVLVFYVANAAVSGRRPLCWRRRRGGSRRRRRRFARGARLCSGTGRRRANDAKSRALAFDRIRRRKSRGGATRS